MFFARQLSTGGRNTLEDQTGGASAPMQWAETRVTLTCETGCHSNLQSDQPVTPINIIWDIYLQKMFDISTWNVIITTSTEQLKSKDVQKKLPSNFHSLRAFSSTSCHRTKTQHSIFYISNPSKSLESLDGNLSGCVPQDYHLNSETKWKMSVQILGLLAWKSLVNQLG